jgi:hypothetical protein
MTFCCSSGVVPLSPITIDLILTHNRTLLVQYPEILRDSDFLFMRSFQITGKRGYRVRLTFYHS